ncbi:MAG: arsenosugar biosynthesis radical SAM protein ArsS [Planctomycetota bacterium]|nr:arsenosugar biosynthesis radical SAM protein ArsS [Planctomycetota bacterium]
MPTLLKQGHPFADTLVQLQILQPSENQPSFDAMLAKTDHGPLRASGIEVLQVDVGKLCNQTCRHCHVDAGPDRREIMDREIADACLRVLDEAGIPTLDITGGAPEMNPHFRRLVSEAGRLGRRIIDRCNLTILLAPGYDDLPEFLAEHRVDIVASLPCYLAENTDAQRGDGVFDKSIEALRRLNDLGYGRSGGELDLALVYNPLGPSLPPPQAELEAAYRRELKARYDIEFNRLYTITNMPISRFLDDLVSNGHYDDYMQTLLDAWNPETVPGLMCRTTLSVSWDGRLFDCDFNQMLDLGVQPGLPRDIRKFDFAALKERSIVTGQHCFGCTAGAGSGCQGAISGD